MTNPNPIAELNEGLRRFSAAARSGEAGAKVRAIGRERGVVPELIRGILKAVQGFLELLRRLLASLEKNTEGFDALAALVEALAETLIALDEIDFNPDESQFADPRVDPGGPIPLLDNVLDRLEDATEPLATAGVTLGMGAQLLGTLPSKADVASAKVAIEGALTSLKALLESIAIDERGV